MLVFSGAAFAHICAFFRGFIFRCVGFFRGRNLVDEPFFREMAGRGSGMFFRGVVWWYLGPSGSFLCREQSGIASVVEGIGMEVFAPEP